jgi:hypothetical protein
MRLYLSFATLCSALAFVSSGQAASSGQAFYGDPPDEHHPWAVHDQNRPQPPIITPGSFSSMDQPGKPPSDAIVLFDGKDTSHWEQADGSPLKWVLKNGWLECKPGSGDIRTKDKFGDCQLHIEWAAPKEVKGESQGRGNSGIFLMGKVEIQVLDSYNNLTYADGHAASVYGVSPPMANALRPPGEFQVYDIIFRRPIYKDGKAVDSGYVTVFVNGVLAQDHTMLEGGTGHMTRSKIESLGDKGPLSLQDHGNTTRFRNIWYRELPPRISEGSTDGYLSTETTMAKRNAIAAEIRADAQKLTDANQLLRYMEALSYDSDSADVKRVENLASKYLAGVKALSGPQLSAKKDEVLRVSNAFKYLARFKQIPADFAPKGQIETLIKDQGWDKKAPGRGGRG